MGLFHSASPIVFNDLIMCLDAANPRSYNRGGSPWIDITGNYNATMSNMDDTNFSTDGAGSFFFDGTNEAMSIPIYGTWSAISFDFWAYFDDPIINLTSRNGSVFGDWTSSNNHFAVRWSVGMHWNVNASWSPQITATGLKYGWNHYALIWDNNNNSRKVYLNNLLVDSRTTNGTFKISSGNFAIGVAPGLNQYYKGGLASFKIYDRALSASEVSQNYLATSLRYT